MKKTYISIILTALVFIAAFHGVIFFINSKDNKRSHIKVGIVYVGDGCNAYTYNFMQAVEYTELEYGDRVEFIPKFNVCEGEEEKFIRELIESDCSIIFATSYGYGETVKRLAGEYPEIEFCMATCSNANTEPVLSNYHTFMGEIYQGRYVSGVVAGMKLKQLIDQGEITPEEAVAGYVGAYPYAEVISGYTAFLLGIREIVPEATMKVIYTNSWGDYDIEKRVATKLINDGCIIISQHSDTSGPAVACEQESKNHCVYHVGYNQSMFDVAPTTSLISSKIDWKYYITGAVGAVLSNQKIENYVSGNRHGQDIGGGFKEGWVQMLRLNETIAAPGTQAEIDRLVETMKDGQINVFYGDYIGVDPFDSTDTYDLRVGYSENKDKSAPSFHYVLKDVIVIEE